MYGYVIVVLIYIMLAILSRKNYSKYKDEKYGLVMGIFYAMADKVFCLFERRIDMEAFMVKFRRLSVASPKGIYFLTKKYIVKAIGISMTIFLGFSLVAICKYMVNANVVETNIIEREEYQGNAKELEIELSVDEESCKYNLKINPMEYTKQEFIDISNEMLDKLQQDILGQNESLNNVCEDLILPTVSKDGCFTIEWQSDNPMIMSSYGKIVADKKMLPAKVKITANVKYLDFVNSHVFEISVCNSDIVSPQLEGAKEALNGIESNNRSDKTLCLPEEINGVKISKVQKKKNTFSILLIGLVISIAYWFVSVEQLKDKLKARDKQLMSVYPSFVNKLWLLIGTGMNVKDAFIKIVRENRDRDLLTKEIEYAINQINSGFSETKVYEELGIRIGLAPYIRLMNRISQNIKKGNKDLRKLMEEEVYLALNERKELVKKKGEEASTKMLVPMIFLLGIVMVIVMFPAMMNF